MAIRIFLMGKKEIYPQRWAWGKIQSSRFESIKVKAATAQSGLVRGEKPSHDLSVESAAISASMQAFSRMPKQRPASGILILLVALAIGPWSGARAEPPTYEIDQGVALADAQNPDIVIARKRVEAARGGLIEARSGYLPSVISSGF